MIFSMIVMRDKELSDDRWFSIVSDLERKISHFPRVKIKYSGSSQMLEPIEHDSWIVNGKTWIFETDECMDFCTMHCRMDCLLKARDHSGAIVTQLHPPS